VLVHTGQHYDPQLADLFFDELEVPAPDHALGVGPGTPLEQTAAILLRLEALLAVDPPDLVLVYGDTTTTLAGGLAAAKLGLPVAHVEAGLRSFDMTMPEEVNRRVTDVLADLCLVTSPEGVSNLLREGVPDERIHFVGNPMIDSLLASLDRLDPQRARASLDLPARYAVATVHRPANVDSPADAERLVAALNDLAGLLPTVLPLHPRGRPGLTAAGLTASDRLRVVDPLGYLDFLSLVRGATLVVTDSGGIQEETTVLGIPCLTIRPNTERPITVTHGTNRLVRPEEVGGAAGEILTRPAGAPSTPPPLWDGHAGERIARVVAAFLARSVPA